MNEELGSAISLCIIAIIVTCFWLFSEALPFRTETTVYRLFCTGALTQGKCNAKEETANPSTYKAFVDQQTIVYWFENSPGPKRLQHCAIRNAKNWSCQLGNQLEDNPRYEWQMIDGQLRENGPTALSRDLFYQVPKWRWWLVWLEEKMR
jgi:hypothetical protein